MHYFSQTLTTLNLYGNDIVDQGAEYLANALQQNNVTLLTILNFLFKHSFIIPDRHSQRLASEETTSVIKE
jgi:hypothetical protein